MDLSIRDWMLVIGVLLILAVLLDGYRRVRKDRVRKVRMSLKPVPAGDDEPPTRGELPNGGARVASRGNRVATAPQEPTFGDGWQAESDFRASANRVDDEAELPDIDAVKSQFTAPAYTPVEPEPTPGPTFSEVMQSVSAPRPEPAPAVIEPVNEPAFVAEPAPAAAEPAPSVPAGVKEIIVVNAISRDPAGFSGEELLHILLTCDLRFGKMNIFHRYEKSNAKGAVQFSVANAVEPGTFDLNNMRTFNTPGICLFLQLPGPQDAQKALEYMVETAQCIARNLNGELRDENRSALTVQTVEHYRSRIREFDRKRMAKHA